MRKALFLFILFNLSVRAQVYDQFNGVYSELLLDRTPSAASEALGKSFFNFESNAFSFKTNPAMFGNDWSADAGYSYSSPHLFYNLYDGSYYNYMGAKASLGSFGSFGFSRYYIKLFDLLVTTIENPDGGSKTTVEEYMYSLAYSREIAEDLSIGILVNYMRWNFAFVKFENSSIGLGAVKIFKLKQIGPFSQSMGAGLSFENLIEVYQKNNSRALYLPEEGLQEEELDVVLPQRVNASLSYKADAGFLSIKAQVEYRDLLNSAYLTEVSEGLELGIYDMLLLRAGNYNYRTNNKFTYGFGVKLGELLFKNIAPLEIIFDYARPNYEDYNYYPSSTEDDDEKFDIYSLNVSYKF